MLNSIHFQGFLAFLLLRHDFHNSFTITFLRTKVQIAPVSREVSDDLHVAGKLKWTKVPEAVSKEEKLKRIAGTGTPLAFSLCIHIVIKRYVTMALHTFHLSFSSVTLNDRFPPWFDGHLPPWQKRLGQ